MSYQMKTIEEIGTQLGMAIARDVIADGMDTQWTGLDAQDGDHIPPGMDRDAVEAVAKVAYWDAISEHQAEAAVEQFNFCTDSESGTITARDFTLARMALKDMLTDDAIANGAWGWIDDQDGNRYWIAEENSR
jgi:hypothetical protein